MRIAGFFLSTPCMGLIMTNDENEQTVDKDWKSLPDNIREALKIGWSNGMPPLATAIHARWWQLETWLRTLVYVELRTKLGSNWVNALPKVSEKRQQGEDEFGYMATPDAQNRLAYTDASILFEITLEHWDIFENLLLPKNIWAGRIQELLAIRNRMGHCRRPHADDLLRLEQTLRDLEKGAFSATSSFNNQWPAKDIWIDEITDGWAREQHDTARRLIKHAERSYDTIFELKYSRRPWSNTTTPIKTISGVSGYVWHAFWYFRGGRPFKLDKFWQDIKLHNDSILLVCAETSSSISVSFSAMEDPKTISNTIGECFDAALTSIGRDDRSYIGSGNWQEKYADLDPRVHIASPWALVEESMRENGISIFNA